MADPSSWISFMDYLGLNGEDEKALMSKGQDDADLDTQRAQQSLYAAGTQAHDTGVDMTATASYGDYVTAQRQAQANALKSTGPTGNPYEDAMRSVIAPQFQGRQDARDTSLAQQYKQSAGNQSRGYSERQSIEDTNKALADSLARQAAWQYNKQHPPPGAIKPDPPPKPDYSVSEHPGDESYAASDREDPWSTRTPGTGHGSDGGW